MFENVENKLKKNYDPKQIGHILLSAKEHQWPVFVWRIIGDKKILAQINLDAILSSRGELRISPKAENAEAFSHVVGGCDHINFFFPHSSLLFQSTIKGHHGVNGLNLTIPDFVAHMERRLALRLHTDGSPRIRVQFIKTTSFPRALNQFFGKNVSDISSGGLSFLVSKHELRFLVTGEDIKNIEIVLEGEKIKASAKVIRTQELNRNSYPTSSAKTYRVSLEFKSIEKKNQERLSTYVFQNLKLTDKAV